MRTMRTKNDYVAELITYDINCLAHYGTPGMKRGVWGGPSKRYQNHAVYARGNPRYARQNTNNKSSNTYEYKYTDKKGNERTVIIDHDKNSKSPLITMLALTALHTAQLNPVGLAFDVKNFTKAAIAMKKESDN